MLAGTGEPQSVAEQQWLRLDGTVIETDILSGSYRGRAEPGV